MDKLEEIIIVGSGFAGSIMARLFAEQGRRIQVIEKREQIAGNMCDYIDENGIRIQKYGPHIFHTSIESVYQFLSQYTELEPYQLKCEVLIEGISTPSPFNFRTIDQFYNPKEAEELKNALVSYYKKESATVLEMLNCEVDCIREYAKFLFEKDYGPYTAKQWGKTYKEIDPSILSRVPVVFHYKDTYFYDKYEGIPRDGFQAMFESILDHPNITVSLNEDALEHITIDEEKSSLLYDGVQKTIIYTGAIDELFDYKFGKLPYRSLYFEYETHKVKDYQNVAIVAHPTDAQYTRITEYTKLPFQDVGNKTVIAKEYSILYDKNSIGGGYEPYYPVLTESSIDAYRRYKEYSTMFGNLILCGRLADFKYYNMDSVIDRTLKLFQEIKDTV